MTDCTEANEVGAGHDNSELSSMTSSLIPTLAGHHYTDPSIFVLEQDLIFERMWFCAVRGADVGTPGAFRTVQVGRENLLITRSADGEARAFLNVCRHRGARLCAEESGSVKRTFRCMYHAWAYGLDGKLVAAPNLVKMPDVDRDEYGLRKVRVREWLGYVWVCLADDPPSFERDVLGACEERLGDLGAIDRYGLADLVVGHRIRYDVRANWKLIIENFMECYHCSTIHPELVHVLPEFAGGYAAQCYVGHGAEFGPDVAGFTVDGGQGVTPIGTIAAEQDRRYTRSRSSRRSSSTSCPTTRSCTGCSRWPWTARSSSATGSSYPRWSGRGWIWVPRSSCSTASTGRTSRPASAASHRWPPGRTPKGVSWCRANTTSARSTGG